jgi:hypothetical protein
MTLPQQTFIAVTGDISNISSFSFPELEIYWRDGWIVSSFKPVGTDANGKVTILILLSKVSDRLADSPKLL